MPFADQDPSRVEQVKTSEELSGHKQVKILSWLVIVSLLGVLSIGWQVWGHSSYSGVKADPSSLTSHLEALQTKQIAMEARVQHDIKLLQRWQGNIGDLPPTLKVSGLQSLVLGIQWQLSLSHDAIAAAHDLGILERTMASVYPKAKKVQLAFAHLIGTCQHQPVVPLHNIMQVLHMISMYNNGMEAKVLDQSSNKGQGIDDETAIATPVNQTNKSDAKHSQDHDNNHASNKEDSSNASTVLQAAKQKSLWHRWSSSMSNLWVTKSMSSDVAKQEMVHYWLRQLQFALWHGDQKFFNESLTALRAEAKNCIWYKKVDWAYLHAQKIKYAAPDFTELLQQMTQMTQFK